MCYPRAFVSLPACLSACVSVCLPVSVRVSGVFLSLCVPVCVSICVFCFSGRVSVFIFIQSVEMCLLLVVLIVQHQTSPCLLDMKAAKKTIKTKKLTAMQAWFSKSAHRVTADRFEKQTRNGNQNAALKNIS